MAFTKEQVANMLATNDKAVYRGLVVLFERQTSDEQRSEQTNHLNKMGFNARDAKFGTSLAKQILEWENASYRRYPTPLSPKQLGKARSMIHKYAGQLARVANEKAGITVTEVSNHEQAIAQAELRNEAPPAAPTVFDDDHLADSTEDSFYDEDGQDYTANPEFWAERKRLGYNIW